MLVKELAKALGRFGIRVNALVGARCHSRRRLRCRSLVGASHSVRSPRSQRGPCTHGPRGVVKPDICYVTGAAFVVDGGLSLTNWFDPPVFDDI
jgi:3-oxoacyl-[acyl-carrier protein] reductase